MASRPRLLCRRPKNSKITKDDLGATITLRAPIEFGDLVGERLDLGMRRALNFGHHEPDVERGLRMAEMSIPDDATAARYRKSFEKMVEFVGRMYKAGVPIVAGTDGMAGFTLQSELEWYVKAGLTPSQALQIATWNGAKYCRVLDDRGSIAPGKRADLVVLEADPLRDIRNTRRIRYVVLGGRFLRPDELLTVR